MQLTLVERALSQGHHKIQVFVDSADRVRADEYCGFPLLDDCRAVDGRSGIETVSIKYRAFDELVHIGQEYGTLSLDCFLCRRLILPIGIVFRGGAAARRQSCAKLSPLLEHRSTRVRTSLRK